ncbi:glycosyltransferase family 4 protein [Blautia sp. MSJ-19]|uniref:glycosyltransferase family 4 protein n=1 Tax=Blautia sp. MSJ-19 TaxID=2841517 RepID=UPI001C0E97EA|nr:glycosyltransferase family 4 protein [Blautia sp. MSJ-19]MBU5480116.1 glycosyltransferase family 4 protein [Blautia sp. MSJ-19]
MNILHLEYSGGTGGIEKLCKDIALNAKEDKHCFLFVHEGGRFFDEMQKESLDVQCLKFGNKDIVRLYSAVKKTVQEKKIDAIIIHHPAPLIWLSMLLYLSLPHTARVLVYAHNVYEVITVQNKFKRVIYNKLLAKCDGVVAISEFVKDTFLSNAPLTDKKVCVIYNGIECPDECTISDGTLHDPLRIIYVGRLIEEKGVQVLLKALSLIKEKVPFETQIVGDGPYRPTLEALKKDLKLEESVQFCGNQSNVNERLQQADLFIHPCVWNEAFGLTIAEALSYGKICIATRRGAIPEIIQDGENGFLVDSENPEMMAEKIEYVYKTMTEEQRLKIRQNAVLRAQDFKIENLISQLHDYISSLKQ